MKNRYEREDMDMDRRSRTHRRYRIKSRFRFITSMVIAIGLLLGTGSLMLGLSDSIALTKHETKIEYVESGDTLWSIANEYKSEKTGVREAIYKICAANDIKADQLQSGMKLVIPDNI